MVQRRSRRAQRKPPEVVPPKSDEEPDAVAPGDANTAESEEENDANTNTTATSSRPRRRQRARKPKGAEASENEDNSSDEGKSQENTDTGASSDEDETSNSKANQSQKRTRRQKKPAETDEAEKKTPRRRGRQRKNAGAESNDEEGSDDEKETIRKSKRRNAGRRKLQDYSSASEDEQTKKVKRRRGRPKKNQDADDGDSKVETAEEESGSDEESTKKVTRRRGRPKKFQDADDHDSKMDSAEEDSANESTKKVRRRRGRPKKLQDTEDNESKTASAEEESASDEEESTKKVTRRRGRPRKNQDVDDSDSKMESASEEEPTRKARRKRGRPRKNRDVEDNDSKIETAEEEESGSDKESSKKVTRRRGRPRKNQDAEDNGSKVDSDNEESADEEESSNKVKTRRGRPKKVDTEEEENGSGGDENETAKSDDNRKSSSSKKTEDASNDETTSRPKRTRRRPKKSADVSSNDEGEKEAQPEGVKTEAPTPQTPDHSSNDEQSGEEEATRKRSRSGRPQSVSTDKGRNETSESPPRKRGRGRRTPPASNSDEEPSGVNLPTRVSKSRLERIDETSPAETDSAAPPGKGDTARGPAGASKDKPTTTEEAKTKSTPDDKDASEGSSSQQESTNGSASETPAPSRRGKRQRVPPEQLVDGSAARTSNIAAVETKDDEPETHEKKRPRMDLDDSAKGGSEMAGKSVAKEAGPSSTEMKAQSSPNNVETKDSKKNGSSNTTTTTSLDVKERKPVTKLPVPEKKDPVKEPTRSVPTDAPKKQTPPKETKTETNVVPPAASDSTDRAVVKGESQKRELQTKVEPSVTKSAAMPSSELKQVVSETNARVEQNKVQKAGLEDSIVHDKSKPNAENESSAKSLQPTKKVESSDIGMVKPPHSTTSVHLKKQDQSLTGDEKKTMEDKTDTVVATSQKIEKKATLDGSRATSIDAGSPMRDVEMGDAEKTKRPPATLQKDKGLAVEGAATHPKVPQPKPAESMQTVNKPEQTTAPIGSEGTKSAHLDIVVSTTKLPTKSEPSETAAVPRETISLSADSNTGAIDSKESLSSEKNSSNRVESSPVTESSDDEDESDSDSDTEEATQEPRFETKVLPFNSPSILPSTDKEKSSEELIRTKVNRVKMMLYTIGSRVHRGRGFERLFSKYWNALTMRLSDRLSSHAGRQCNAAIKAFLKSPKLRKIHNKLVLTLMKTSIKSFAPLNEISEYVPEMWHDKVKRVDRVIVEDDTKETKRQRKARAKRAARKHTTIYSEAWASTSAIEDSPISADCLKTESRDVDMKKIHASSASIPGALVIDPLVRELAEQNNLRASENAIWLLIVAAREHTSNILKNALKQKKDMESGEVSDPFLKYPKVIAGTKIASKKDSSAEKNEQQTPPAVDYIPGKCQTRKVVTSFDIYASSLAAPSGPPASLGGGVSTTALEHCLQNAYTSSSGFSGANFADVQKHIVEGITALAHDRKAMLLARGEEAKSNPMNLTNSQQQVATNAQNIVHQTNSVVSNPHIGAVATTATEKPVVDMNVPAKGHADQHQNPVTAPTPTVDTQEQQQKADALPAILPTNAAAVPSNIPVDAKESSPGGAVPGGQGRGAKDLASLMKRTPNPTDTSHPAPVSDDKGKVATESAPPSANSSPQKEKNYVDELGTSTGSGRRGRQGFGTKNLAAMRARSSKPGEEKASPRESVPATVSTKEAQKQQVNTATRPTGAKDLAAMKGRSGGKDLAAMKGRSGGKDLAAMKGPSGAKDLAALKARSVAVTAATKSSEEAGKTNERTDQTVKKTEGSEEPGAAKLQGATEPKSDTKEAETNQKAAAPGGASTPSKPSNTAGGGAPTPAIDSKLDSSKAPNPAEVKQADVPSSEDKSSKGNESDNSVVVVEGVKPAAQNLTKDASSSEVKSAAASSEKPIEQKIKDKDANPTTSDTNPKPAATTEKPNAETDKPPQSGIVNKKETSQSDGVSVTAEAKRASAETKEDGGTQSTASPGAAAAGNGSDPAASENRPKPKGAEASSEAGKAMEGNTAKPERTKADESDTSKPEEKKVDASTPTPKDEKAEFSK